MENILSGSLGWSSEDSSSYISSLFNTAYIQNLGAPTGEIQAVNTTVSRAEFQGLVSLSVRTDPQTISEDGKAQARENISSAPLSHVGSTDGHPLATTSDPGFMSPADKTNLSTATAFAGTTRIIGGFF